MPFSAAAQAPSNLRTAIYDRSPTGSGKGTLVFGWVLRTFSEEVVDMLVGAQNQTEREVVPLSSASFCLDCEVISNSRGDECPACKGHSLLSLARILGGSLRDHKLDHAFESGPFDVTLTVALPQLHAKDVNTTLEGLTNVIGTRLAQGRASLHID